LKKKKELKQILPWINSFESKVFAFSKEQEAQTGFSSVGLEFHQQPFFTG